MPLKFTLRTEATLLEFCLKQWPEVKRTQWKLWLKHGALRVNGQGHQRHDHLLKPGDVVEVETRKYAAPDTTLPSGIQILHEDEHLLLVEKPSGLLTISSAAEKERTLYWKLNSLLKARNPRNPERVFIVHRLDKETSGLMVLAKTPNAKNSLQDNWDAVTKTYAAVVEGRMPAETGRLEHHVDESDFRRVTIRPATPATRKAVSVYRVIKQTPHYALLEVDIETGRRHQIRVQLAASGCVIAGDELYGAQTDPARRVALHALRLTFVHPGTGRKVSFESKLPAELRKILTAIPSAIPKKDLTQRHRGTEKMSGGERENRRVGEPERRRTGDAERRGTRTTVSKRNSNS
jgi:23S rRNA pseudouridine1911/1915/1917 synthase